MRVDGCVGILLAAVCFGSGVVRAQDTPISAQVAITSGCNTGNLGDGSDTARTDPTWVPVFGLQAYGLVTILEGRVIGHMEKFQSRKGLSVETLTDQSPSEVAEEDLPWNHFTHDKTIDVVPDPGYKHLLSSFVTSDGTGTGVHPSMEVEWENGSSAAEHINNTVVPFTDRLWGGLPTFAWASPNDRVWIAGRWIFDCGHPGSADTSRVQYETEIHPPRAMVVFRLNHRVSLLNTGLENDQNTGESAPSTWLPVTGGATALPVTEADIFVSGNGGGANDKCNLINRNINAVLDKVDSCTATSPVIPVNDRNYVFDIYPPGTDFSQKQVDGNYPVVPPSPTASLQWKIIDRTVTVPTHSCGVGPDPATPATCITVAPILCLVDDTTPPPTQIETGCPARPTSPTRLRVILPFLNSNANVFAQSILLGWDDVPGTQNGNTVQPPNQTYAIRLHKYTVLQNGESSIHNGDWRVFADVGGQWRFLSLIYDRDSQGNNVCHGDPLTNNGNGDCYQFDQHPWIVSVPAGMPIHVALGGYESDDVDSHFCYQVDNFFNGGNCQVSLLGGLGLAFSNDDRLGTVEFDLDPAAGYQKFIFGSLTFDVLATDLGLTLTTVKLDDACKDAAALTNNTGADCSVDGNQYQVQFTVTPVPSPTPPASSALTVGKPSYTNSATHAVFVAGSTPLTVSTNSTSNVGFQYRFVPDHGPLPSYDFGFPFPFHWTFTGFAPGPLQNVALSGGYSGDGGYTIQHSAEAADCNNLFACGVMEPRHSAHIVLDTTPPVITISQPAALQYPHSATLTLSYNANDGAGSGVASITAKMDGSSALADGHSLASGQTINLLTELPLGAHTFSVASADNVGNAGLNSVTFTIIVTPASIENDVSQFLASGDIKNQGEAQSLLAKLTAAATSYAAGDCTTAGNVYGAFINELNAQSGNGISATAAQIMLADAQYLIGHCPN